MFNQLIDELKIPMNKFKTSEIPVRNNNQRVNFRFDFGTAYDDDYIDFDDFEKWSRMNENQTRIPNLKYTNK